MERLSLSFPVTPHIVNRGWGVPDPLYREFGFERHNGVDLALMPGQEIRAPFDCRVTRIGNQPQGSGIFVSLLSRTPYLFPDGRVARVEITLMHLQAVLVPQGARISTGTVIALGGNSGRSTGPHTHLAAKRVRRKLFGGYRDLDTNDAANTFDPTPYWETTSV